MLFHNRLLFSPSRFLRLYGLCEVAIIRDAHYSLDLFVFVEIEYGYLDVSHVDGVVVIDVCVGFPVWRVRVGVEIKYQVLDVSHVADSVVDS